jgi:hypothetical protein
MTRDQTAWEEKIEQAAAPRAYLLDDKVSLDRAWHEINHPAARPTPSVTIEAIWLCVRERGIAALAEKSNQERLTRCDDKGRAELERRIEKLRAAA